MEENIATVQPEEEVQGPVKPEYEIKIPADQLSAYVRVLLKYEGSELEVEEADVLDFLGKNGVNYGILNDDVKSFCQQKNYYQWQKVAVGSQAEDGEDGSYSLTFDPTSHGSPQEREDGTVDYRELGTVKNVFEDEVLCNIVHPTEGKDGVNVYGGPMVAKAGKAAPVDAGVNVKKTEDGTEFRAATDGCAHFKDGKVYVDEAYNVKEDVSLKTGNVQFNGSITISQNVLQGFKVNAQKDIFVKGIVEGAELTAGGNIVIAGGITGMSTAKIEAGGDVTAKFIENATVICGGNVHSDILMMANVKAEKSVILKGTRSAIIGGNTLAGETISCKALGSDANPRQTVAVRKNWRMYEDNEEDEENEQEKKDKAELIAMKKKLFTTGQYIEMFEKKIKEENSRGADKNISAIKEYMVKKSELNAVRDSLNRIIDSFKEDDYLASITCTGFVYPGVKIGVDNCWMTVTEVLQNTRFYVDEGKVVSGASMPSESS